MTILRLVLALLNNVHVQASFVLVAFGFGWGVLFVAWKQRGKRC